MARCPFCNEILEDSWLKKMGASLMGKASGVVKARSREVTSAGAKKRWKKEKDKRKEFPT